MAPSPSHPKTDPSSWARYRTTCAGCTREFLILYRCRDHLPTVEKRVQCPGCGLIGDRDAAYEAHLAACRPYREWVGSLRREVEELLAEGRQRAAAGQQSA